MTCRLYFLTWNVKSTGPCLDNSYLSLLGLNNNFTFKYGDHPDFYIIFLQEQGYSIDELIVANKWLECFKGYIKILHEKLKINYVKIFFKREFGLISIIFCKKKILKLIRNYECKVSKTSFLGLIGLKGAITMKFDLLNVPISFTNCHLSANDYNYKKRIQEYNIIKNNYFKNKTTSFSSNYTFCLGDLNFRTEHLTFEQVIDNVEKKNFDPNSILIFDQLIKAQKNKEAFYEFNEGKINFKPTFKRIIGSDLYDKKRVPSYCDRILYSFKQNQKCDVKLKIYDSYEEYKQSDHKPVFGLFDIELNLKNYFNSNDIKLLTKSTWILNNSENVFVYKPKKMKEYSQNDNVNLVKASFDSKNLSENVKIDWDWIGLFPENFYDIDEYVAYVYLNDIPIDEKKDLNKNLSYLGLEKGVEALGLEDAQEAKDLEIFASSFEDDNTDQSTEFELSNESFELISNQNFDRLNVIFSDQAVYEPGKYKLVYVNKSGCVESISKSFEVIKN